MVDITTGDPPGAKCVNTLVSGHFWGFLKKKHRNTCGFAWEFLPIGKRYGPGRSVESWGKCSSQNSKKIFLGGGTDFL